MSDSESISNKRHNYIMHPCKHCNASGLIIIENYEDGEIAEDLEVCFICWGYGYTVDNSVDEIVDD